MQKNYNDNLVAGAAIRDDKGRRISKLFEASHPKMTVGYAKNLIMPDTPTEQEFNFRQAGGGVIEDGVAVIDKVKGRSLVWNQGIDATKVDGIGYGLTVVHEGNGVISINGTSTTYYFPFSESFKADNINKCVVGHTYLYGIRIIKNPDNLILRFRTFNGKFVERQDGNFMFGVATSESISRGNDFGIADYGIGAVFNDVRVYLQYFDLTQMFGAGNEPTTYEEFLQRKPKVADEYAYNEGTIVNNKVEKVVTTGKNLWDEEWELGAINNAGVLQPSVNQIRTKHFIPVSPSTTYFFHTKNIDNFEHVVFFGEDKTYISYAYVLATQLITTPEGTKFIKFDMTPSYGATYNHDICINLSDASFNGQYAPYEKHELDLSWIKDIKDTEGVKLFEDGMRSAGSAYDEAGAKEATKRIVKKVFDGTENIVTYNDHPNRFWFALDGAVKDASVLQSNYYLRGENTVNTPDKTIGYSGGAKTFCIRDSSYSTENEFKAHLASLYAAGTPLVVYYELAEPIVVEYDEKNLTYPVVAGGTEEAIASEPSTAFRADIGYGIDAVKTILDLKARVKALEEK